jgi:TonB family protein
VSLAIHLIFFLFATFYVIEKQYLVKESHIVVDITHYKSQRPRIRRVTQVTYTAPVLKDTPVPHVQYAVTTAAQIPVAMGESIALPAAAPSVDPQLTEVARGWKEFRHRITPAHQVSAILPPISPILTTSPRPNIAAIVQTVQVDSLELHSLDMDSRVIPLSEATQPPRFIHKVVPKYPPLAKRAGKEGVVILTAEIGVDGKARNIEVVQGIGYGCDEAATAALLATRFLPAYKGEYPVAVRIQIPYRFKINTN